jgi:hypothetical protein
MLTFGSESRHEGCGEIRHKRGRACGLVVSVRNRTHPLIEREDDTRSWSNFLIYFSHNVMPSNGLELHTYRLLASQEYARC